MIMIIIIIIIIIIVIIIGTFINETRKTTKGIYWVSKSFFRSQQIF